MSIPRQISALIFLSALASSCNLGKAVPGQKQEDVAPGISRSPVSTSSLLSGWKEYHNPESGLSFNYPPSLVLAESEGSTNFESKVLSFDLETPEYAAALEKGVSVETGPFLRIGADIPKHAEPSNQCGQNETQTGVVEISGYPVRKCESLTLGQFHHLDISFSNGSPYTYFIQSDEYTGTDKDTIDYIIQSVTISQ